MKIQVDEVTQTIAFQCRNCGECCGPVPFSQSDIIRINAYLHEQGKEEFERMKSQKRPPLTCQFRDIEKRRCFIHPVRPEICRMQGYYEGLPCPHQPHFATKSREEGCKRLEGNL